MKVVLIRVRSDLRIGTHPRELVPPIILLYSATLLKSSGFEVKLFYFDWRGLEHWPLPTLEPAELFIIKANSVSFDAAKYLACLIKERFNKPVALDSRSPADENLNFLRTNPCFDYSVYGDPEKPILELARYIAGKAELSNYVWTRERANFGDLKPYIEKNLDSLPFPDQSLLPNLGYSKRKFGQPKKNGPWRFLLSNRGCPYSCLFCSSAHSNSFGTIFRAHSPEYMLSLIAYYRDKFGLGAISFEDDTFAVDRGAAMSLCEGMKSRGLVFPWVAQTRPDLLDRELLNAMKSCGCFGIALGVTTLDNKILASVKRGFTVEQVLKTLKLCQDAGISVLINKIVGLPGQSLEQFIRSVKTLMANLPKGQLHVHKFDPKGCYNKGDWLSRPTMMPEKAEKLQVWAYRKFYFRPRNLLYQFSLRAHSLLFDSGERKLLLDFLRYSWNFITRGGEYKNNERRLPFGFLKYSWLLEDTTQTPKSPLVR